jgi:nitroreductase
MPHTDTHPNDAPLEQLTESLISSRQNVSPKRLVDPGPSDEQLAQILRCAACAPDHGLLRPWRFVLVPRDKRALLAEVFAQALTDRDPTASAEQLEAAREKAYRAPVLMLVVARLGDADPPIPWLERMVSVGAAVQNMLLMAHALGFGAGLTSGQAMSSPRMRALFRLADGEKAVCFLNIGTVAKRKASPPRAAPETYVSTL